MIVSCRVRHFNFIITSPMCKEVLVIFWVHDEVLVPRQKQDAQIRIEVMQSLVLVIFLVVLSLFSHLNRWWSNHRDASMSPRIALSPCYYPLITPHPISSQLIIAQPVIDEVALASSYANFFMLRSENEPEGQLYEPSKALTTFPKCQSMISGLSGTWITGLVCINSRSSISYDGFAGTVERKALIQHGHHPTLRDTQLSKLPLLIKNTRLSAAGFRRTYSLQRRRFSKSV